MARTVDVSGLTDEAVKAVEAYIAALRAVPTAVEQPAPRTETAEEWVARFTAWVDSHISRNPNMDDSRESIYDGCGE